MQPDRRSSGSRIWHPYTRSSTLRDQPPPSIHRGSGLHLYDREGRTFIDAISSWWCMNLGHAHPPIVQAIQNQAETLPHSILGNLSHPYAEELANRLARLLHDSDRKVLFASDGSSAIEQAMKMALQHAWIRGDRRRTRFAALHHAYHGDTLGALSAGFLPDWHAAFRPVVQPALTLSRGPLGDPIRWAGCETDVDPPDLNALDSIADELAAVIVEPLCLGASGMQMYSADTLRRMADWCRQAGILLIVDEIAMGFGRTGRMFAHQHAGIDPDIVCVGKALTAGHMPLSATIARRSLFEVFADGVRDDTFQHGHTFCGHPIGCAAALAALEVYDQPALFDHVRAMASLLAERLLPLASRSDIRQVRCLGLIGAIELHPSVPIRGMTRPHRIRQHLLDQGVLMRPLGNVIYLAPPLTIKPHELEELIDHFVRSMDIPSPA